MIKLSIVAPLTAVFTGLLALPALASLETVFTNNSPLHIAQYWDTCGQMGWVAIDTFTTDDFYVSICQDGEILQLVGEAKDGGGFLDMAVLETRDRRYAIREGEDVILVDNELLNTQQDLQSQNLEE